MTVILSKYKYSYMVTQAYIKAVPLYTPESQSDALVIGCSAVNFFFFFRWRCQNNPRNRRNNGSKSETHSDPTCPPVGTNRESPFFSLFLSPISNTFLNSIKARRWCKWCFFLCLFLFFFPWKTAEAHSRAFIVRVQQLLTSACARARAWVQAPSTGFEFLFYRVGIVIIQAQS